MTTTLLLFFMLNFYNKIINQKTEVWLVQIIVFEVLLPLTVVWY